MVATAEGHGSVTVMPGGGELRAQRLRVRVHAGLRGRLTGRQRDRQEGDARADRHQAAGAARDQMRGECARHPHRAQAVKIYRALEVRE